MADPIIEQIAQVILERIGNVSAPAYNTTLVGVDRWSHTGNKIEHLRAILIQESSGTPDDVKEGNPPSRARTKRFRIPIPIQQPPGATQSDDQVANIATADVEKAICTTGNASFDWAQMDGLAINSELQEPVEIQEVGYCGQQVIVDVTYRTQENDPYTQA